MIVIDGRAMITDETGLINWVVLPKDPRQRQAARSQLEASRYSAWAMKVLFDAVGRETMDELALERFSILAHYQQIAAMYSALARDKMT